MATFTITTNQNIDELIGKVGGDIYNINGGILTIDQDSRIGLNQNTSATLGNITCSATLGGQVIIDSSNVRVIPFVSGVGNVPNANTLISRGGANGLIMAVYPNLTSVPTAVGTAMPSTGFIKIKKWNGVAFSVGALSGISASSSSADVPGWLEIIGDEAGTCTVNRLNLFKVIGGYFSLGTSNGVRGTAYQIPSSGVPQYHAGVEVETSVGSGVYEFYPCTGSLTALNTNIATDPVRGKVCWISNTGVVRFGSDGTNSTGGYNVPTGLKIRIPNVFFHNCLTTTRTTNALPNATLATRYKFDTLGGGVIDLNCASMGWYLNLKQPYSLTIKNTNVLTGIVLTEVATPLVLDNLNVGQEAANTQLSLAMSYCFAGGLINNCNFLRALQGLSGAYVASISDVDGFTFTNNVFETTVKATNATVGSLSIVRGSNINFNKTKLGAGRMLLTTCINMRIGNTTYYDSPKGNTTTAIGMYAFDLTMNCIGITIDGIDFGGLYMSQPYNGLLNVGSSGCVDIKLRNIGTYENPLSLGSPRMDDVAWSRVTTTATINSTNHGLLVNDVIYVVVSSNIASIIIGAKTITAVPSADSFQFVVLNAGNTTGTISYFGTKCGNVFVIGASSAANNVKIQRVYAPHTRTNLYTVDNTAKNITMENVFGDYLNAPLLSMLNGYSKSVSGTPPLTAQTAVYGTHWFNGYVLDVALNINSQSYTRVTTVVTVTANNHSLRTGMLINIDPRSAPTTFNAPVYTVTVLTSNMFTVTVANAGASSGTLSFRVANGRLGILMNEASSDTLDRYVIESGNPQFTSAGGLYMPNIGDKITFKTPNYLIGQGTSFPPFEAVMGGSTLSRYRIEYSLDMNKALGYGSFYNMYYERSGAIGTISQFTFTVTDSVGVAVGDYVWGTGISPNAYVTKIVSNTITVNMANIATVSGVVRFNHMPSEIGMDTGLGIKMKWRITTVVVNTSAITSLYVQTESTTIDRGIQYPLDTITLTLTNIIIGSDVVILQSNSSIKLSEVDQITEINYNYDYASVNVVDIAVFKSGYVPLYIRNYPLSLTNTLFPVSQVVDRNYIS